MKKMDNNLNDNNSENSDEIEIPEFSSDEIVEIKPKKKNKKKLKLIGILVGCTVLTGLSVTSTTLSIASSKEEQIKPYEQIMSDADYLGADLTLLKNRTTFLKEYDEAYKSSFLRLKNNGNHPIYVYIDDIDNNLEENIKETLDETQDLLSYINENYHFKIVSKQMYEVVKYYNQSAIRFSVEKLEDTVNGDNTSSYNYNPKEYEKLYIVHSHIKINSDFLERNPSKEEIKNVLFHEILHSFGFPDLYNDEYKERLCYMNVTNRFHLLHPNDIKMLYCAYGNKHIDKEGNVDKTKLQQVKEALDKYEKYYYEKVFNDYLEQYSHLEPAKTNKLSSDFKLIEDRFRETLIYEVKDDKYKITILDLKSNLIEEITGEVLKTDKYIVFKDVVFNDSSSHYCGGIKKVKTSLFCTMTEKENFYIIDANIGGYAVDFETEKEEVKSF